MDMKKFFGLMVAAVLGGSITYALLNRNDGVDVAQYQQGDSIGHAVRPMQVNYSGMIDFRAAASSTVDAVVHVKIRSQQTAYENPIYNFLFGKPNYQEQMPIVASGSGVIISRDGYIVTNNHVIEGADALEVTLDDKRTFTAKVIGADPTTDIALIKI